MPSLLDPIKVGDLTLPNRIFMAPLTRSRAIGGGRVPNPLMAEYYMQRASAGMILSEATSVTPMGVGYPDTPGIWSEEQVEGWKLTTAAVHAAGGHIFLQLWHVGRVSHSSYLNGEMPVSSSAIALEAMIRRFDPPQPYETPRALDTHELAGVVEAYRIGAQNAQRSGFDGVEVHGANGYLPEQFLKDGINKRTDEYGGSLENRARLMLEITDACIGVWGRDRVGMHLSPHGSTPSTVDSDTVGTYGYVLEKLSERDIAFVCLREPYSENWLAPQLRQRFNGVYVANDGFNFESGESVVEGGLADAVAYGRPFIANPDLPRRFSEAAALNEWDVNTFYTSDERGYIDYPFLA